MDTTATTSQLIEKNGAVWRRPSSSSGEQQADNDDDDETAVSSLIHLLADLNWVSAEKQYSIKDLS